MYQDLLDGLVTAKEAQNTLEAEVLVEQLDVEYLYDLEEVTVEQVQEMINILTLDELETLSSIVFRVYAERKKSAGYHN